MKKLILTESQLRDLIRQGLNEGQRWSDKKENAASFQSQKDDVYAYFTRLALEVITKKEVLDTLVKAYDEKGPSEGLADSVMGWSWKKNIDKILASYGFIKCLKDYSDNFKSTIQADTMLPVLEWQKYDKIVRGLRNAQKSGNQDQASALQKELTDLIKGQRIFISIEKDNEPKLIIMFGQFDAQKVRSIISTGISNDSTAKSYKSIWGDPDVIDYIEGDEGDVLSGLAATAAVTGAGAALLKKSSAYQNSLAAKGLRSALPIKTQLTPQQNLIFTEIQELAKKDTIVKDALIKNIDDVLKTLSITGYNSPATLKEALKALNGALTKHPDVYKSVYGKLGQGHTYAGATGTNFAGSNASLYGFLRLSDPSKTVTPAFRTKMIDELNKASSPLAGKITINASSNADDIMQQISKSTLNPREKDEVFKFIGGLVESRQRRPQLLLSNPYKNEFNKMNESGASIGKFIGSLTSMAGKGVKEVLGWIGGKTGISGGISRITNNSKVVSAAGKVDDILNKPFINMGVNMLVPTLSIISKASAISAVVVWALYGSSFKVPNTNWIEASRLYVIDLNKFSTQIPQAIQVILDDYQQYLQESGKIKKSSQNDTEIANNDTSSDEDQ